MTNDEGGLSCAQGCWLMALGAGIIALALLMVVGDWRLIQALFAFTVITIILGSLLQWLVCKPATVHGGPARKPSEHPVPSSKESAAAAAAAARAGAEPVPATPAQAAAIAARGGVKPSKELAGEAELASRKGTWKYDGGATEAAAPAPVADAPEQLKEAREGGPDDLKMIKGVGPKLEELLHKMGFFHFDQIASWTDREVAWVDENLEGFKGRVSRDNWVEQAKKLAAGETTEFSDKVKKGDVY